MKDSVELEPMNKIGEIRRFSNKDLRLSKESMGAVPRSSEYCGPIRKKSYSYVSGIIGMAYNPFLNEDIRDCFFDYEQAVLLRFWTSRIAKIRSAANQQTKLGLVLEEKVTAPSVLKSDNLMTQEVAAVACAKRRDALYSVRFMVEQIALPALNTCVKMLREGDERAKALLLLALLDIYQSKLMRVKMKEPVELEPMNKTDEIRRFSNKELRLLKESMGALPRSSAYCGPIRKKSYSYVSGIIGTAYNPFLNEDIRDCFFDYDQAVLLRFWTSSIATIRVTIESRTKVRDGYAHQCRRIPGSVANRAEVILESGEKRSRWK